MVTAQNCTMAATLVMISRTHRLYRAARRGVGRDAGRGDAGRRAESESPHVRPRKSASRARRPRETSSESRAH
eukprot:4519750-Prymnesium_polylepis.1